MCVQRIPVLVVFVSLLGSVVFGGAAQAAVVCSNSAFYGWEDGGTVLGLYGTGTPPIIATNVTAPDPVFAGLRSLRLEDNSPTGTPEAQLAWVTGLLDGDIVEASFFRYDTTPGSPGPPSCRIWGMYTAGGAYAGSAGGNSDYGPGTGWDQTGCTWTFDDGLADDRDGLLIVARTYSNPGDTVWVDELYVCAPEHALIQIVPEPAGLALLALGGMLLLRRRRGKLSWETSQSGGSERRRHVKRATLMMALVCLVLPGLTSAAVVHSPDKILQVTDEPIPLSVGAQGAVAGVVYSNMSEGPSGYWTSAVSDDCGYDDYDSINDGPILLEKYRFIGGVEEVGDILWFDFYSDRAMTNLVNYFGVQLWEAGIWIWTVTITSPITVPDAGVCHVTGDDYWGGGYGGGRGQWYLSDAGPTVGTEDPFYGSISDGSGFAHLFELQNVPEPAGLSLLALGGLALLRRRRGLC